MTTARRVRMEELVVKTVLANFTLISVVVTFGIIFVLGRETVDFFRTVGFGEFFLESEWAPLFSPRKFGIWPLVSGSLMITFGAAVIGLPAGLLIAIYLNEYAPEWLAKLIKPVLEILAGVPSVVYGFFAISAVTPVIKKFFPETEIFNALSASVVVGVMIVPFIASICDDALRSVPQSLKDGAFALGATGQEVLTHVTIPAAISGIVAAFILAVSRAFGETMAVTLAAGSTPNMSFNFLESVQTLTAYIVQVCMGDVPHNSIEYKSVFAVGSMLFICTLIFNLAAWYIVKKMRRV